MRPTCPSGEVPDWMVRVMAPFSARSRMIVHELNRDLSVSAAKAKRVLGWQPRPDEDAIRASAQSLIDHGLIAAALNLRNPSRRNPTDDLIHRRSERPITDAESIRDIERTRLRALVSADMTRQSHCTRRTSN